MGARMLQGEFVVLNRIAGPTRRDPRIEIVWQVAEPGQNAHPFLCSEGHVEKLPVLAASAESGPLPPNE